MQNDSFNETLGSCRPWNNENQRDDLNTLTNLQLNLFSLENVYKKHSVKNKTQLPQVFMQKMKKCKTSERSYKHLERSKIKTMDTTAKSRTIKNPICNRSVQLNKEGSDSRLVKAAKAKRAQFSQLNNKQNQQSISHCEITSLKIQSSNRGIKNKVFMINFDEQNKYRRLRKRELHHLIFGERNKTKNRQIVELR